ncbi:glycosyltransferase family 4 protein [Halorubrum lacusprofundi]|uniref:glycosyltransferase family 4 protein n=1 Tax=Halorubrum lacusprofundi TaxID=2247 RepID=UPI000B5A5595|nr:glycosyltransferase family 4 protein [Halorubrum lacusprofundi]MCG1005571.1 glycosyltransferase family 4 protein [Halorubrum lacusprofundi]
MRVGLALYGSLAEQSGGFRYDRKLVEGLRRAGDTVEVVELPWRTYPRGLLDNALPDFGDRLRVDVDVMLQDELAHPSLLLANRDLPYPIVSIVHHLRASEPRRLSPLYRAVERRYLATVDGVVCNSAATRDAVAALGVARDSTVVAPPAGDRFDPAIDDAEIASRARNRPLGAIFVGNIEPRKGLDTLVEAVALADADIELTVVGRAVDEEHVAEVRRLVRERELDERVRFTGRLSDAELAEALRESHVLAVPSRYEGFGIVYLEGMSFGLPAIASRAGGAIETVADGETGVLVDPDDPVAVARALDEFATDPDRLAAMGRAARRRYERHPSWAESTARVRRLLADVADAPDPVEPEVAT